MAGRRAIGKSRAVIVARMIDDEVDDELDVDELLLVDDDLLDLEDEDAALACADDDGAWCDRAPWIDEELRSALWWAVYRKLEKRRRVH